MLNNRLISIRRNYNLLLLLLFVTACATLSFEEVVQKDLEAKREDFESCYHLEVKTNNRKELKGNIILDFEITRVGIVKNAKIQNSFWMSKKFESCVLEVLANIVFTPKVNGKTTSVIHPINFYPGKSEY